MSLANEVKPNKSVELEEGVAIQQKSHVDTDVTAAQNQTGSELILTRDTKLRLIVAGYAFFCAGVNDGSLGPIIPYLLSTFQIKENIVSVIYGITFFAWFVAALTNSHLSQFLDLGAMLVLGASLQLLAHVLRVWLPPFGLYATSFFFASLGQALQDTHANSYVSTAKAAHRWLGFIHAMYMLGCLVGPFVSTAVSAANTPSKWNLFYSFPLALCAVNVVATCVAFRDRLKLKRRSKSASSPSATAVAAGEQTAMTQSVNKSAMQEIKATVKIPSVWILSLFFFFFLGTAITASGWVVTYLVEARNGDVSKVGYVNAGYFGGGFLGRALLAEPVHRFGERKSIFACVVLCLALQLVFWLVPSIIAGAVAISFLGFFSGPFFATGIHVGSKLFPADVKSSALVLVFLVGQIGGSIFPAVTGIIAARAGVKVLQPILVGLIAATGITWLCLPRVQLHQE